MWTPIPGAGIQRLMGRSGLTFEGSIPSGLEWLIEGYAAFASGDVETMMSCFVDENPLVWEDDSLVIDGGRRFEGSAAVRRYWQSFSRFWSDIRMDVLDLLVEGNRVAIVYEFRGKGALSGAEIVVRHSNLLTLQGDRIQTLGLFDGDRAVATLRSRSP